MTIKHFINSIIDSIFEKKRVKHEYKPLTNQKIIDGLECGRLFVACIVSTNKNFISKAITYFSGPFSHVVAVCDIIKYPYSDKARLVGCMYNYYSGWPGKYGSNAIKYVVLASADENGMNYFDLSVYQNREMIIFEMPNFVKLSDISIGGKTSGSSDKIIGDLLSEKVMNAHYDYTGLVGQIFKAWKWLYRKFDDERAYYCSELDEIFRKYGVKLSDEKEPSPTQIYKYCKHRYRTVYSNLKKNY